MNTEETPAQTMIAIRDRIVALTQQLKIHPESLDDPGNPVGHDARLEMVEVTQAVEFAVRECVRVQRILWNAWYETYFPNGAASYAAYLKEVNEQACRPNPALEVSSQGTNPYVELFRGKSPEHAAVLSEIDQTP